MILLVKRFLTIAALTTLEAIRQPILLILTASCVLFIGLMPVLLMHTMGDAQKLVQDSALALHFLCGLLLGGYAASAALGNEIRRGTIATVLSKPVDREVFFLAKFAGVVGVLILFSSVTIAATLMSAGLAEEMNPSGWNSTAALSVAVLLACVVAGFLNYYKHWSFSSTAFVLLVILTGMCLVTARLVSWRVLPASLLVTMATFILTAIALALVTRLDLVPSLAICTVIFLVGLMTDYLLGRSAATHPLAALAYNLIPNWQHFWLADALAGEETRIPWAYVGRVSVYAIFYLLGTLSLGMLSFRSVETKA